MITQDVAKRRCRDVVKVLYTQLVRLVYFHIYWDTVDWEHGRQRNDLSIS